MHRLKLILTILICVLIKHTGNAIPTKHTANTITINTFYNVLTNKTDLSALYGSPELYIIAAAIKNNKPIPPHTGKIINTTFRNDTAMRHLVFRIIGGYANNHRGILSKEDAIKLIPKKYPCPSPLTYATRLPIQKTPIQKSKGITRKPGPDMRHIFSDFTNMA